MTNLMKKLLIALVVILVICIMIFIPSEKYRELTEEELTILTKQRKDAYEFAVRCSDTKTPALKFEDIDWVIVPGNTLKINAVDGTIRLNGYYSPQDSIIYMPYRQYNTFWIMVHESLHAIGYIGHPRVPFELPCNVMPDQNS